MTTRVSAGRLDRRITLQQKTAARGALGGHQEVWSNLATVWAEVRDLSGREIFNAKAVGSAATRVATIRYRADVKADHRVLLANGIKLRIEWLRRIERHETLELYCLEIDE
ncbi:Head-tail adaptor [Ferriphaselus amnicola]|uniref:Head-tail adaptor n=1 Tax=Ferriphaselus amnicola TaxID=1188319 RepID=A0A2Z6GBM7_9PROT|nr:phage head closure protein [Ferriphaselus amnicola]BBE50898.1 Head-tail adaptor [Ferriphaselus amnicola]